MSELEEARRLLERAEQGAIAGDFISAEELLRRAAAIQEKELGPLHPDLANTLNNLAIVAEKSGRLAEAEAFYRRAAAIAVTALPSDHPMVAETRQNLADFCLAHGVRVDVRAPPPPVAPPPVAPPPVTPRPDPPPSTPMAARPLPAAATTTPEKTSHLVGWAVAGAVLLLAILLLIWRPWSPRKISTPAAAPEPQAAQAAEPAPPPSVGAPAGSAAVEQSKPSKAASRESERHVATSQPPAAGAITLAIAEVCRNFSTSGGTWRCQPVGSSVTPGPIVFYTRVKSPRDTTVVHRWYRGNTLRQSVRLGIHGNATEGYRTYSRQTVTNGDWRVEVRSTDGALLNEQRFVVR